MYRKLKADNLFTGTEMFGSNKVLVIKKDGAVEAIIDAPDSYRDNAGDVETFKGIISPGFINTHCHLELSHMKGLIPEKTGLVDFVYKVVNERHLAYRQAGFVEEEILDAIETAEDEMLLNGIVAAGDICNNLLTLPQKKKKRLAYYNFIEASGWLPSASEMRFERALNLYNQFQTTNLPAGQAGYKPQTCLPDRQTTNSSIVPHAPYSVSDELWELIIPYFQNKVVSIHNQETSFEDEFFLQGTGDLIRMYKLMNIDNSFYTPGKKSSLQTYFNKLYKAASIILVHNTFTTQADIDFAMKNKADDQQLSFCVCINANQYIENTMPPIKLLMQNNCNIVLGTDSLASNHSLNLLDEMKTIQKNFSDISLEKMLQWATLNGAKALQIDKCFGSFEKGKKPGVVLIENCLNYDLLDLKISKIKKII